MFRRTRGMGTTGDVYGEHELRVEAALLGITRRLQDGDELQAATGARLRHALKRLEAAAVPWSRRRLEVSLAVYEWSGRP